MGAVTVGVGSLVVWGLLQDPAEPWQRMPDGSRIRVLGVTYGTEHRVMEGQVGQRLLLPLLPPAGPEVLPTVGVVRSVPASGMAIPVAHRVGLLGGQEQGYTTPKPTLIVWLRYRDARYNPGVCTFQGEDEHGCRFPCETRWYPDGRSGGVFECLVFDNLPRRSPTMRLRSADHSLARLEAAPLTVRLPNLGPQPVWEPRPLPQRSRNGPLAVSMVGWAPRRPVPTAEFEVRSRGRPTLDWEPITLTVSDATGNSRTSLREQQYEPDPRRFGFLGLCTHEAAWKLHTEWMPAVPPRPAAGARDSGWSPAPHPPPAWRWAGHVSAPRPGKWLAGGSKLERPELRLEVLGAAGVGRVPRTEVGVSRLTCPAVRVQVTNTGSPVRLTLVRVTDERGRTAVPTWQEYPLVKQWMLALPRPSHLLRSGTHECSFVLPELAGARQLKLEFVAHRAVPVEFTVAPPPRE